MITPVEIQSKAFKSGIGYDKKDVDTFISEILENYEELYRSNVEMKDKINMLNEGLQHYKNIEASLQKALVLAEKTSEETIRTAELKAQTIEMEAVNKAKEHTADAKRELERVHNQTVTLVQQYTKYKAQFTQFLNAQLELITSDSFKMDANDFAAFARTAASPNDAYMNSNPINNFSSDGDQTLVSDYNSAETSGQLGERDDAERYNFDYNNTTNSASAVSSLDASVSMNSTSDMKSEPVKNDESEAVEGEVENKVDKRSMLEDEDANSTGFTFI